MIIKKHIGENNDYTSNTLVESFPDGLDCEIMKYSALEKAWRNACLQSEREHVTLYIKNGDFKKKIILCEGDRKNFRWTLDTEKDYYFIKMVYERLYYENNFFVSKDIYRLLKEEPEIMEINKGIVRNEGLLKSLENDRKVGDIL